MSVDLSQYSFDSIAVNMVVVWLIQQMKLSNAPVFNWISENTPKVTMFLSAIAATITAAGMSVNWDVQHGAGTLTISGITMAGVLNFVFLVLKNVVFQHGAYKLVFQPRPSMEKIEALLKTSLPAPAPILPPQVQAAGAGD